LEREYVWQLRGEKLSVCEQHKMKNLIGTGRGEALVYMIFIPDPRDSQLLVGIAR